jgi:Tfp pilus assembly protein PilO
MLKAQKIKWLNLQEYLTSDYDMKIIIFYIICCGVLFCYYWAYWKRKFDTVDVKSNKTMQSDTKNATSIFSGLKVFSSIFCAADGDVRDA